MRRSERALPVASVVVLRRVLSVATDPATRDTHLLAIDGDGAILASAGNDGRVRLWDADSLAPVGDPIETGQQLSALAFNQSGQYLFSSPSVLASASWDGTIRLWDVPPAKRSGPRSPVMSER